MSSESFAREEEAKTKFLAAKKTFEVHTWPTLVPLGVRTHTIVLLKPNLHLTYLRWRSFNRWVKKHPGWRTKRREATESEKEEYKAVNIGKSYSIDIIYEVPNPNKKPPTITTSTTSSESPVVTMVSKENVAPPPPPPPPVANKTPVVKAKTVSFDELPPQEVELPMADKTQVVKTKTVSFGELPLKTELPMIAAEDEPPSKKQKMVQERVLPKYRVGPFALFGFLSEPLKEHVLSFADVPTLGACVSVSKHMHILAKRDCLWSDHLRFLLKTLFDPAFDYPKIINLDNGDHSSSIVPISERPQQSTEFVTWLKDCDHLARTNYFVYSLYPSCIEDFVQTPEHFPGLEHRYNWLMVNVPLREYYKQAGAWAYEGQEQHVECCQESSRCPYCLYDECDCRCQHDFHGAVYNPFEKMPFIPLFYCGL